MSFVIKLKGGFHGYYTGLYRVNYEHYVGCTNDIKDENVKKFKKRETAERHIEKIEDTSTFAYTRTQETICEIVEVEEWQMILLAVTHQ